MIGSRFVIPLLLGKISPFFVSLLFNFFLFSQVGKHDKMGMNVVPLKDLTPEEPKVILLDLLKNMDLNDPQNDKSRGQLEVELMYKPFKEDEIPKGFEESQTVQKAPEGTPPDGGLLVVIVHEGQDLEGKHHTNPQVKLLFRGEERRTKVYHKHWRMHFLLVIS